MAAPHVIIRRVRADDIDNLLAQRADPERLGAFNVFADRGPIRPLHNEFEENGLYDDDGGMFVVEVDGAFAGDVGFHTVRYGPNRASRAFNIGISLDPAFRGRGVGVIAQRLLAERLLAEHDINRIEASTDIDNVAEQRALEKAGFTREGVLRGAQNRGDGPRDMVVYSFIRADLTA